MISVVPQPSAVARMEAWFREDTEVIDFFAPRATTSCSAANLPTWARLNSSVTRQTGANPWWG